MEAQKKLVMKRRTKVLNQDVEVQRMIKIKN